MSEVPRQAEALEQPVPDVETRSAVVARVLGAVARILRQLTLLPGETLWAEAVHDALTVGEARPAVGARRPGCTVAPATGAARRQRSDLRYTPTHTLTRRTRRTQRRRHRSRRARLRRGRERSLLADVALIVPAAEAQPGPAAAVVNASAVVEARVLATDVPAQFAPVAGGRADALALEPGGRILTDGAVETRALGAGLEGGALAVHAVVAGRAEADGGRACLETCTAVLAEVVRAEMNPFLAELTNVSNRTRATDA